MKKLFIILILFVFSTITFAQKGMGGDKQSMECCKSCVLCNVDKSVSIRNTEDGILIKVKVKNKADIENIQKSIKNCCCFKKVLK